jgi:hypothetical protein
MRVKGKVAGTVGLSSRGSGQYDRRRRDVILLPPEKASDVACLAEVK